MHKGSVFARPGAFAVTVLALALAGLGACEGRSRGDPRPVATVAPAAAPSPEAEAPPRPEAPPERAAPAALPAGFAAERLVDGLHAPAGLAFDSRGRLHVLEGGGDGRAPRLLRLDAEGGRAVAHVSEPGARWHGLDYGPGGFVVTQSSPQGDAVLRLPDAGGAPELLFAPRDGEARLGASAVGPDGAVYTHLRAEADCLTVLSGEAQPGAAGPCNAILRLPPDGPPAVVAADDLAPVAMRFAADGTLYAAERPRARGAERRPPPRPTVGEARAVALGGLRVLVVEGVAGFDFATAGVFGEPDIAFIAEADGGRVLMLDTGSGDVRVFANEFLGLASPRALRFEPAGRALYVLDATSLWRIGADGGL